MTRTLDWSAAMLRVPRERFIPDRVWRLEPDRAGPDLIPIDRDVEPRRWAAMVAADEPVYTQVDNGRPGADGIGMDVTSSCSDRRVVRDMLESLAPGAGDRVLEIGTGTGWNAALLAEAGARVTSIEVDAVLAARARELLAGTTVDVVTGDGVEGFASGGPYDSIISTVGTREIPWTWVEQTRLGGRIVVPLTGSWHPPGLVVLRRDERGAIGRIAGPADFMLMRAQARSRALPETPDPAASPQLGTTEVYPYYLCGDRDAAVAIDQRTDGISFVWRAHEGGDPGDGALSLYTPGARAIIDATTSPPYTVEQTGRRRLVDEVLAAYHWWQEAGEPTVGDWRVAVGPGGQRIELAPERSVTGQDDDLDAQGGFRSSPTGRLPGWPGG